MARQLPVGLQVLAKPFDEATMLRVAHAYEQSTDWHKEHPRSEDGEVPEYCYVLRLVRDDFLTTRHRRRSTGHRHPLRLPREAPGRGNPHPGRPNRGCRIRNHDLPRGVSRMPLSPSWTTTRHHRRRHDRNALSVSRRTSLISTLQPFPTGRPATLPPRMAHHLRSTTPHLAPIDGGDVQRNRGRHGSPWRRCCTVA